MNKAAPTISNPDDLDKHLQRTSPVTWIVLGTVTFFLLGFFLWSLVAQIPFQLSGFADISHGEASLHVDASNFNKLAVGQKVYISGIEGEITSLENERAIATEFALEDGEYSYYVVIPKRPFDFLLGK